MVQEGFEVVEGVLRPLPRLIHPGEGYIRPVDRHEHDVEPVGLHELHIHYLHVSSILLA